MPLEIGAGKQRALLAVLLLEAGSAVPMERLIDALWEEDAPASAVNSVHVYVSQLRKLLGARLVTRGHGYALDVEPGELDLHRFEQAIADGREHLARGDADGAARVLREGLALWRGPALADFTYERFAQDEIRRLEELRLTADEERIDADLERGRHSALVPELEVLVREHPLRERLRGQLMLALYRCGRQADALEAYRTGRDLLVEEVGLEPGPALKNLQAAILRQDPDLEPARPPARRVRAPRRRRGPLLVAGGGALLLVAIVTVALAISGGDDTAGLTTIVPNSVAVIDPATDRIVADIPVGATPTSVAVGEGGVWVLNADDRTVSKIDARRLRVERTVASQRGADRPRRRRGRGLGRKRPRGGCLAGPRDLRARWPGTAGCRLGCRRGAPGAPAPRPGSRSARAQTARPAPDRGHRRGRVGDRRERHHLALRRGDEPARPQGAKLVGRVARGRP